MLNCLVPIITNVCRLVEEPTRKHEKNTFCLQTRLESCHQKDIEKLERELKNIRGDHIYEKLEKARNNTVAHTHSSYQNYGATQRSLLEDAEYLIKHEDRLNKISRTHRFSDT